MLRTLKFLLPCLLSCVSLNADEVKPPVKVFILAGQSNMEGHGFVSSDQRRNGGLGSLEHVAKTAPTSTRFGHLLHGEDGWRSRDDVWISYLQRRGPLTVGYGVNEDRIGPELGFGWVVGDAFDAPVLLIKCAWGGKSLAVDFRPPSSGPLPYSLGEKQDAAIAQDPSIVGKYFRETVALVRADLQRVADLIPGSEGRYELSGFGWHQGWNDRINDRFNGEYERNMANFIRDIRSELRAPRLPFVIAETGMNGPDETHPRALSLMKAQAAVAKLPEFQGNVTFVPTQRFWRAADISPTGQGYHWNTNAETYYLIGDAMGRAMLDLQRQPVEKPRGDAPDPGDSSGIPSGGNASFAPTAFLASETESVRPNFLLIYADDHGHGDVSTYQSTDVRTPHIDQLAAAGMLFTSMRANATVCSPSRAALLTGRYADRVGVPGVIRTHAENSWGYFLPSVPTLGDALRKGGYHTAIVGKWHLGLESPNTPNERGFDHFQGFLGDMMDSYTTHLRHGQNYMRLNGDPINPTGHATDLFTEWACEYLTERAREPRRPFLLYLAYNAPHFPIEPPAEWLEKVRARAPEIPEPRARNVAFVEHLDDRIGRVLTRLEQLGLAQNTVVVFTSDNGGSLPHAQSNKPWRDGKQSHYDGGLRVPFMVRWSGHVKAGSRSDYAGLTFDLYPTFLELAGIPLPNDLDAVSLVPILRGSAPSSAASATSSASPATRDLYFVRREGGIAYGGNSYEAIIRGDWKLLRNSPYEPLELYNLRDDPFEQHNVAAERKKIVNELGAALRAHIQRGGAIPWQKPD